MTLPKMHVVSSVDEKQKKLNKPSKIRLKLDQCFTVVSTCTSILICYFIRLYNK